MVELKKEEEIVISYLKSHGYFRVELEPDHIGIEADGKMRRMIVAVKAQGGNIATFESLKELATKKNREAWLATVGPKDNDITWSVIK